MTTHIMQKGNCIIYPVKFGLVEHHMRLVWYGIRKRLAPKHEKEHESIVITSVNIHSEINSCSDPPDANQASR